VVTSINNLIIGKLNIDHGGVMRVVHKASGHQVRRLYCGITAPRRLDIIMITIAILFVLLW
jgi:hypothetical protein